MAKVLRSLDEFRVGLAAIATQNARQQRIALRRSRTRLDTALGFAAKRLAGSDGRLSRVGGPAGYGRRTGGKLSVTITETGDLTLVARAGGPWSIRDSSVTNRRTNGHSIGPNNGRNPRPLPPATIFRPSLEFRGGGFTQNEVSHPGSARIPAWRNAIQSVQPPIIDTHQRAFEEAIATAIGG